MQIKAVVFDIGGVLETIDGRDWLESWRQRLGLDPRTFEAALDQVDPDGLIEIGRISEAGWRQRYGEVLGLSASQLDAFVADMWRWYCGRLNEELMEFARSLRPTYVTAILSNSADGARREEQARYDFAAVFDPIVYSHEVGLAKPDPRIYRLTCEIIGVEPAEAILLDDLPANIDGARAVGMSAVLHRRTSESVAGVNELLHGSAANR